MILPNFNAVPENAGLFVGYEWNPYDNNGGCASGSAPMCITGDASAMTVPGSGSYQVFGSNKSINLADMVAVDDETGSNAARLLTVPFIRPNWPFKYIGIKYVTSGGTGTVTVYKNSNYQSVTLNG